VKVLVPSQVSPKSLYKEVARVIEMGKIVRKGGIVGLEAKIKPSSLSDEFLKECLSAMISGHRGPRLRVLLSNSVESTYERNMVQVMILNSMATVAPAFGMVGTLVGLIVMLDNMGGDSSQLGSGLALALLTTLYGVLFAQLIFKPAANKLKQKEDMIRFRNNLLVEGFMLLSEEQGSMMIQDFMNSHLDPRIRFDVADKSERKKK
jgi:chemotaxis protein MotA